MQIIDTFSGIGGFSLAGKWMGWKTIQFCEINPFCNKILNYHFPCVPIHDDIRTLTFDIIKNSPLYDPNETTIFTGGVPCQPWSLAGRRLGKKDDRNLWPETIKLIGQIQPDYAVLENVFGLINWNGGLVFDEVQTDLEAEGYEVQPYVLPACGVNAPHKRDRVWFVAHRANTTTNTSLHGLELLGFTESRPTQGESKGDIKERERIWDDIGGTCQQGVTSNTESQQSERMRPDERESCQSQQRESGRMGCEGNTEPDVTYSNSGRQSIEEHGQEKSGWLTEESLSNDWENFPTFSPICTRNDGISSRLVGITFPKWRNESIKAMGNAIVPQVALEIFKVIQQMSK